MPSVIMIFVRCQAWWRAYSAQTKQNTTQLPGFPCSVLLAVYQGVKYSIEASSSIDTGVEMTHSHLAD